MVFYDSSWIDFGTKVSLAENIARTTGIEIKLLIGKTCIGEYNIAQKMSWASCRETTRIEDMAYSLMGIFDVNMPLLYGEGWKAFRRLEEEIIRTSTDQSIFAWKWSVAHPDRLEDKQPHHRGVLASSPIDFQDSDRIVPNREDVYRN